MIAEQHSAYVRLPYENLIMNQIQITPTLEKKKKNKKNHKGSQEKLAKLYQPTWLLHQNKHYLDSDEENIRKKPTNCPQTPLDNKTEATTKKDITDTQAETFSSNSSLNDSNPHFLTFKNNAEKPNSPSSTIILKYTTNPLHQQNYKKLSKHRKPQQSAQMKFIMIF